MIQSQFGYFYRSGYWCPEIVFHLDDLDYVIPGNEKESDATLDEETDADTDNNMNEESSS